MGCSSWNNYRININEIGIDPSEKYTVRDIWKHKNIDADNKAMLQFPVESHGVVFLKINGKPLSENPFKITNN